jgi:pimeloyl-ACP methyl ester carboxylesterase
MRPVSSLVAITIIFEPGAWATLPIKDRIPELTMPVCFMYGKKDWMCKSDSQELLESNKLVEGSRLETISEAGHMLMLQNPHETSLKIIEFVFGEGQTLETFTK